MKNSSWTPREDVEILQGIVTSKLITHTLPYSRNRGRTIRDLASKLNGRRTFNARNENGIEQHIRYLMRETR